MIVQPSAEMPTGTTLGKYDILRKLATGGMAEIYLARGRGQAGFEKLVVLKRILPQVAADPTFVRMFLEEAKLAATLRHPHIADVWEVDCVDGMYFYTMEYIHGQDVRAIRAASKKRNERMPLAIAVGIVSAVASALEYAHDRTSPDGSPLHLVHRDISASNILVSYDGAVKLLDFGIAHAADRSDNTRTGSIKGKVPYMSPEQCQGRKLDQRSDLFSLGTVLYELTVGRRPYRGESDFTIMEQIVRNEPPPPSSVDPDYPAELARIVSRCLTRDLNARYQSADELISDLEAFQTASQLWVSAKVISRFMRSLFWDNIDAWERAVRDGDLDHHITSLSVDDRRPEAVTPPSAFPAATSGGAPKMMPFAAVPESGPVVADEKTRVEVPRRPTDPEPAIALPFESKPPISSPLLRPLGTPVAPTAEPEELRPQRRGLVIGAASLLVVLGGVISFLVVSAVRKDTASESAPPATPEPTTIESTKPEPKAEPTPEPEAPVTSTKPIATPKLTTKVVTKPETRIEPKRQAKPKPDRNSPTEKKTIKLKPEETTWDPNSPVLPPRR